MQLRLPPERRAQDAIAEIHHFAARSYEWVLEGDITACFDEIAHTALMDRVRDRIGDKRVLGLVKAFLKSGILTEDGQIAGHQDRHPSRRHPLPAAGQHRPLGSRRTLRRGLGVDAWPQSPTRADAAITETANYRLVRYADDFVVLVHGHRGHAQALRVGCRSGPPPMGLRLSRTRPRCAHIDEGFDFLGFRIQRQTQEGVEQSVRLHLAIEEGTGLDHGQGQDDQQTGHEQPTPRPPAPDQSGAARLDHLLPTRRVQGDLRLPAPLHAGADYRMAPPQTPPGHLEVAATALPGNAVVARARRDELFQPRGSASHPLPLPRNEDPDAVGRADTRGRVAQRRELVESRMRWKPHVRFGERAGETDQRETGTAPWSDSTWQGPCYAPGTPTPHSFPKHRIGPDRVPSAASWI